MRKVFAREQSINHQKRKRKGTDRNKFKYDSDQKVWTADYSWIKDPLELLDNRWAVLFRYPCFNCMVHLFRATSERYVIFLKTNKYAQ